MLSATEAGSVGGYGDCQPGPVTRRLGTIVGGTYRIERHIGSGGSSHVFEAEHLRLGKSFAVKLLRSELEPSERSVRRFRREGRATAKLRDEHIVSVIDCGELDDGTPYLVMELLLGEDLRSLLDREGALPLLRAQHLLLDACRGVAVAHAVNVVHRDLKPANMFVSKHGSGEDWCKVLDFGVAKTDAGSWTAEGALVGTVRYMAPEQLSAAESVGPASDVYALGAILYECLAGRALVGGETAQETMYAVLNGTPLPLRELRPELPKSIVDLVGSCIEKSPGRRPADAAMLLERLRQVMLEAQSTPRDETTSESNAATADEQSLVWVPRERKRGRRTYVVAAAASIAGLAVALTLADAQPLAPVGPALTTAAAGTVSAQPRTAPVTTQPAVAPTKMAEASPETQGLEHRRATPEPRKNQRRGTPPPAVASAPSPGHFDVTNPYE